MLEQRLLDKIYASHMETYQKSRRWYARVVAKDIWIGRYYEHHIRTLYFLAFERGRCEIESRRIEIRKLKRYFALRQAILSCLKKPSLQEIEKEIRKQFSEENKRLKEDAKKIAEAEKWQKEKMLTEEGLKRKKKEIFYIVEKFNPDINWKTNVKAKPFIKKAMKALEDCDWKTFDVMFQRLKKVPRCEMPFGKDERGLAGLRGKCVWLGNFYNQITIFKKPGAVMGMMPAFYVHQEKMLKNKKEIQEVQERQAKEIAALDKLIAAYKAMVESDMQVVRQKYLCVCQLSGTTHVEGLAEKVRRVDLAMRLTLKRDPQNEHDRYAIMVLNEKDERIGWVPQKDNEMLARLMDAGNFLYGEVVDIKPVTKTGYLELYFRVGAIFSLL